MASFDDPLLHKPEMSKVFMQVLGDIAQLYLLILYGKYEMPSEKISIILSELERYCQPKYLSTAQIKDRCIELIKKILESNHSE